MEVEWFQDIVHNDIEVHLSWPDRLRVLFGAVVYVRNQTMCERAPGRIESETSVTMLAWWRPLIARLKGEHVGGFAIGDEAERNGAHAGEVGG